MLNKIKILLAGFSLCLVYWLYGANTDWNSWQLYSKNITAENAGTVPESDLADGKNVVIPVEGVDLNRVLQVAPPVRTGVLLTKKVTLDSDTVVKLGMGVEYGFEVYCNNEIVYSTIRSGGNGAYPVSAHDHTFALNLRKGKNDVRIFLQSGVRGFRTAIKLMAQTVPGGKISRMTENAIYNPDLLQLRHGPWLLEPSPGAVTVAFLTDGNIAGGVEYRLPGNKDWKKAWHTIGGILQNSTDLHRIRLTDLAPGKIYEYRILTALRDKEYCISGTYQFTVPTDGDECFEFFVTSDTQFTPGKRGTYIRNWQKLLDRAVFQVSLGDLADVYDDFDQMLFGGYLAWQTPETYHNKPFIAVRGNHELRGKQRGRWFGLLGPASGKGYYAFRRGKVCFVVLDTWGGKKDLSLNRLSNDEVKNYLLEQRKWAEELVDSPEYTTADYRIIMAHSSPHACNPAEGISGNAIMIAEPLFKAAREEKKRIHLYLAGHIHKYRRTVPGTTSVYSNAKVAAGEVVDGKKYNFPIVIFDGPGKNFGFDLSASLIKVTPEFLEVKSFDEASRCFDHFTVDKQGQVSEIDNDYKKSVLKKYEFLDGELMGAVFGI